MCNSKATFVKTHKKKKKKWVYDATVVVLCVLFVLALK